MPSFRTPAVGRLGADGLVEERPEGFDRITHLGGIGEHLLTVGVQQVPRRRLELGHPRSEPGDPAVLALTHSVQSLRCGRLAHCSSALTGSELTADPVDTGEPPYGARGLGCVSLSPGRAMTRMLAPLSPGVQAAGAGAPPPPSSDSRG